MSGLTSQVVAAWNWLPWWAHSTAVILLVTIIMIVAVAYLTLWERKLIGWMQLRRGPNRVLLFGIPGTRFIGQPFADTVKLLLKEVIIPNTANKGLFRLAPMITLIPAFAVWAIVPIAPLYAIANIDAGLLYILAMTSVGVYGVILAGWASNSKYAFLGAMRSAAQIVAYEIAMGFALVGVLMASGSLNLGKIVAKQSGGFFLTHWNMLWLFPLFVVYFISAVAETNRAPFDVAEGESEIVAGFHVDYSGMGFALFFLGEYANMILVSALTSVFFLGGWLSPFTFAADSAIWHVPVLGTLLADGTHWLVAKMFFFLCVYLWIRATFPRYRYDQIMRLGWKILIPVTIVWIAVEGVFAWFHVGPWQAMR